ncbi:uncharacterized protein LOC135837921 [Planococcus citri]|uniref:uncharacterized protein LOC135837921 n=1 Tax=Planococcus citri TaxID=170843 RepID=UPI0031F7FA9B
MGIPDKLCSLAAKSSCIPLLYEWASCEMLATDFWIRELYYGTCRDHEWFIWQLNQMQLPSSLVIPNLVREQIEYHMTSILNQVIIWIQYHHSKNFFHDEPASPLKEYLLKLIWKLDRSIDYAATAKNVLAGSNFNPMEKYRFACTYCFSEEVCNLKDVTEVTIDWCFEKEPLLVYWSKYLTNQLHTITLPSNDSIEEIMFAKALDEYDLWQPIKYFFAKLNSGARLLQCKNVFLHEEGKYQKELLALLNECEKSSVYLHQANMIEILKNYEQAENFEGIRQICTELKGKLSFKDFALIIEELARLSMFTINTFNAVTPLLMEIWNDASDADKRRVASTGLQSRIVEKWWELLWEEMDDHFANRHRFRNPLVFIRALAEAYEPRNFLKSNFYLLVIWQPFASIVELMDEFQSGAEDVEEFKKNIRQQLVTDHTSCLHYLASHGEFDEFNSFVSFFYPDNASRTAYQRKFLMDNLKDFSYSFEYVDWRIIYQFVSNVFRDSDDRSVSSCTTLLMQKALSKRRGILIKMMHREEVNSIVECIHTFVPYQHNLSRAKQNCVDSLIEYLHNGFSIIIFKATQFEKLLIWCYGSEAGVAQFKEKINASKVFVTLLKFCVNGYAFEASDSMEEFLHWYYPIESERKNFISDMIYSYDEFGVIGEFLRDRRYRRCMLNWFFDRNAYEVKKFTTFYALFTKA